MHLRARLRVGCVVGCVEDRAVFKRMLASVERKRQIHLMGHGRNSGSARGRSPAPQRGGSRAYSSDSDSEREHERKRDRERKRERKRDRERRQEQKQAPATTENWSCDFMDVWPLLCLFVLVGMLVGNAMVALKTRSACIYRGRQLCPYYSSHGDPFGGCLDVRLAGMMGWQGLVDHKLTLKPLHAALFLLFVLFASAYQVCDIQSSKALDSLWQDSALVSTHQCNAFSVYPARMCTHSFAWMLASLGVFCLHMLQNMGYCFLMRSFAKPTIVFPAMCSGMLTLAVYNMRDAVWNGAGRQCAALQHYRGACLACVCNIVVWLAAYGYTHRKYFNTLVEGPPAPSP